ncbi:hypothetical protein SAMN04488038_102278 [Solimonas aquatica]|uniref:Uncharacterized protein n=1 Tax=Solimonas aquatica TaxID=489703 RepID=A0A1H9BYV6_9GAMM|nr:hypothetical protein SAMN04488038_102278 [Solimonas aquatica]
MLVQREVTKRKHTPAPAPAARVPELCNVLGAVADTPSMAWLQLSCPSWAALPCARRTAQRQRRGPQSQKPQQLRARSSALLLPWLVTYPPLPRTEQRSERSGRAEQEVRLSCSRARDGASATAPSTRAAQASAAATAAADARRRACFLLGTSLCTSKEKYLGRRRAHETKARSGNQTQQKTTKPRLAGHATHAPEAPLDDGPGAAPANFRDACIQSPSRAVLAVCTSHPSLLLP